MLVLSRRVGESIAIGESVLLTLAVAGDDFADFRVMSIDQPERTQLTLRTGQLEPITVGVSAIFIGSGASGVKIGFESAPDIAIQRIGDSAPGSAPGSQELE